MKKLSIHLESTLTDGFLWISLVHLVVLLHFIDHLAPMHELLLLLWLWLLSFEAAFSLLDANDLQDR